LLQSFFEIGEATHFKFRVLIDTQEYWCMNDRLSAKGMCSGQWAMNDNILEMVQDKDIVAMKH